MKLFPDNMVRVNNTRQYVVGFKGLNKNDKFRWGELADCRNLSHDAAPFLYPRGERELVSEEFSNPTTLFMHDGIAVVDGTGFYYKGAEDEAFEKKFDVTEGKKQIAQLGKYTVIFPDKIWYNVEDDVYGEMEKTLTVPGECRWSKNGIKYTDIYWFLRDSKTLQIENGKNEKGKVYYADQFWRAFKVGTTVNIKGAGYIDGDDKTKYDVKASGVTVEKVEWVDKNDDILRVSFDAPLCANMPDDEIEGAESITFDIEIPDLKYICSAGGRIWGCDGNTIFASAYQNPKTFIRFGGLADDSYYIEVTTPGEFTGCAAYSNHVVFFKENAIHKIYGTRPANFQMTEVGAPGVQKGCWDSVRTINERLYYKGERGIYAYMGSVPVLVCEALGVERYTDAVAGTKDHKYYISMKNESENYQLFVFDTEKGTLLREDETQFLSAAQKDGDLYFFDEAKRLVKISDSSARSGIEWSAELREFNETVNNKKGFSRLSLRYEMGEGCFFKVEAAADGEPFKAVATITKPGYRTVAIPLPKNRCDKFRVRISGKGEVKIHNLVRDFVMMRNER